MVVRIVPAKVMSMTPPHAHIHIEPETKAGFPPIITCGAPGIHGPVVTGMQGIGVKTPSAAAVAAATVGLDRLVHIPNGGTFRPGAISVMVAAGLPSVVTRLTGNTDSVLGATPKVHLIMAVAVTA